MISLLDTIPSLFQSPLLTPAAPRNVCTITPAALMEDGTSESVPPNTRNETTQEKRRAGDEDVLSRGQSKEMDAMNKQKAVAFKATHGLLVAFIFLIL